MELSPDVGGGEACVGNGEVHVESRCPQGEPAGERKLPDVQLAC